MSEATTRQQVEEFLLLQRVAQRINSVAFNSPLEEYGLARIQEHFGGSGSSVDSLLEDVRRFSAGNPLSDGPQFHKIL